MNLCCFHPHNLLKVTLNGFYILILFNFYFRSMVLLYPHSIKLVWNLRVEFQPYIIEFTRAHYTQFDSNEEENKILKKKLYVKYITWFFFVWNYFIFIYYYKNAAIYNIFKKYLFQKLVTCIFTNFIWRVGF